MGKGRLALGVVLITLVAIAIGYDQSPPAGLP
jgi:hypothetical protein